MNEAMEKKQEPNCMAREWKAGRKEGEREKLVRVMVGREVLQLMAQTESSIGHPA